MKGVSQTTHLNLEYTSKAGIAQLVEQATENRRVPSSNLGPGTFKLCHRQGFLFFGVQYNRSTQFEIRRYPELFYIFGYATIIFCLQKQTIR